MIDLPRKRNCHIQDATPETMCGIHVPAVSVIIPCRNEESIIRNCLESVLAWNCSEYELEVLVIDGRSTDKTREIVREIQRENPCVFLLGNPKKNKPVALNIAVRAARGEWIVRLDAHSIYPEDYLPLCIETARRTGAYNVGGVIIVQVAKDTIQAKLVQALTTHRFGVGNSAFRIGADEGPVDTVPFGCYRREVFERVGYFDERLLHCQDYEFNQRLRRAGGTIWLNPAIRARYYNQATLKGFFRKVIQRDGPWNPYMWYVAPYSFRVRHVTPIVFVAAIIIALPAWALIPRGWAALACVTLPYSALAGVSAVQQALRYKLWWMSLLLPWLFLAYHVSHGLGGLWGILQVVARRAPVQQEVSDRV